ncbi:hypothetical protein Goshw_020831 [Gossypium schwendimanii]|uniref:DUF4283 domain-containing protein n=1 Tax=Gossypium schwendimanii TaxID=34291 RepID=A0A7J9LPW7_GOSSC|nr:hypothetical protein [Gossypium schwendimanii]
MNKEVSSNGVTDLDGTRGGQPSFEDKLVSITKVVGKLASWYNDLDINILEEDVVVSPYWLRALTRRIRALWKPIGHFQIVFLKNDYYLVKLISNNDYDRILTNGPWQAYGVTWLSSLGVGLDLENREHQGKTKMLGVDKDMDMTYSEVVLEDLMEDQLNG